MSRPNLLDALRLSSPCEAAEEQLEATDHSSQRYCVACRETVHDVSALTREEAWKLVARRQAGERVCISLTVRDEDGAVRLADGYARPTLRSREKRPRALPLLMPALVAAGAGALVACTENAPTREPPRVGLAPSSAQTTPEAPARTSPTTPPTAPTSASTSPSPSDSNPDSEPQHSGRPASPDAGAAQARPPGNAPPKGPALPGHSMTKGGMG